MNPCQAPTEAEQTLLAEMERRISTALDEIGGLSVAVIRDQHLYRGTHPTFREYLRDRWGDKIAEIFSAGGAR